MSLLVKAVTEIVVPFDSHGLTTMQVNVVLLQSQAQITEILDDIF